jgi:hypothetical protein
LKGADRAAVSGAGVELRWFGRFGLLAGNGSAGLVLKDSFDRDAHAAAAAV